MTMQPIEPKGPCPATLDIGLLDDKRKQEHHKCILEAGHAGGHQSSKRSRYLEVGTYQLQAGGETWNFPSDAPVDVMDYGEMAENLIGIWLRDGRIGDIRDQLTPLVAQGHLSWGRIDQIISDYKYDYSTMMLSEQHVPNSEKMTPDQIIDWCEKNAVPSPKTAPSFEIATPSGDLTSKSESAQARIKREVTLPPNKRPVSRPPKGSKDVPPRQPSKKVKPSPKKK